MMNSAAPKFKFSDIELIDFSMNSLQNQFPEHPVFHFELNLEYELKIEVNSVLLLSKISIFSEDKTQIYANITTACIFQFVYLEPFLVKIDNKYKLNDTLAESLNSICISTNRGILFSLLRGTYLHKAIIPIIAISSVQMVQ